MPVERINYSDNLKKGTDKLNQAIDDVNSFQQQIDEIVVSGDSSVEAAQARVAPDGTVYPSLRARLDAEYKELNLDLNGKVGGVIKAEPENLSERTLALLTGTGSVSLLSIPQNESVSYEKTDFLTVGKNLFNKSFVVDGYYVAASTGALLPAAGFSTSGYIPVKPNQTMSRKQSNYIAYYTMDKVYISGASASGLTFTTPANCYYIRISMATSFVNSEQVEYGSTSTAYESYRNVLKSNVYTENHFTNKSIMFLGDSITQMANGWVSRFLEMVRPSSYINVAVSGATWRDKANTPAYDGNPVLGGDNALNVLGNQVQKVLNNNYPAPDAIIIAAGTNDDPPEATSVESQFTNAGAYIPLNDVDRKTFAGSIRWCVEVLQNKYPNTQIFIGTPIQRAEGSRPHVVTKAKADRIEEVAERLSLKVFDAFNHSGIYAKYETAGVKGKYLEDGLHPIPTTGTSAVAGSKTGSTKLGEFYAQEFIKEFVKS